MSIKFKNFSLSFTKEETKKILMMGIVVVLLAVSFNSLIIDPVNKQKARVRKEMQEMQANVLAAQEQIKETKKLQSRIPEVASRLRKMQEIAKNRTPLSWVPPFVQDYFHQRGIEVSSVVFRSESPDPVIPNYKRSLWNLEIPITSYFKIGEVVAEIENNVPIVEFTRIDVNAALGQGDTQLVNMEMALTLKDVPEVIAAAVEHEKNSSTK